MTDTEKKFNWPDTPGFCNHSYWIAKIVPRVDGVNILREFCAICLSSNSGSSLGFALPSTGDEEMRIQSYKYKDKTLGEINKIAPSYLIWLVCESKASDRVKKSAARLLCSVPYVPPVEGSIYPKEDCYDPSIGWQCIQKILAENSKEIDLSPPPPTSS